MASFPWLTGFESTHIHGTGKDVLWGTRHISLWRHDLELVRAQGVKTLRYPVPWHRIEARPGEYDWTWMDEVLASMREMGLDPIVDPIHHTSFPEWLEGGFANPRFPHLYRSFVERFARRYPWVTRYTVFNEPFVTTLFCGSEGIWYPRARSQRRFVRMAVHVGQAICETTEMLERTVPGLVLVHVDTCEHHRALDARSREVAEFLNHRRFLFHDLITGRIDAAHPLYGYLRRYGLTMRDLRWFQEHPARIDVLGLDYYSHSEQQRLRGKPRYYRAPARGFAAVAGDYIERYGLPVMLSETNLKGYVTDRLSWLKHMAEECGKLIAAGADFRGFCWFPFIDSTDWCSLVCRAERKVDPVGIYWLDEQCWERHESELSDCFGRLARGEMSVAELPAYYFRRPWDKNLVMYAHLMEHWDWREPERASRASRAAARARRRQTGHREESRQTRRLVAAAQ